MYIAISWKKVEKTKAIETERQCHSVMIRIWLTKTNIKNTETDCTQIQKKNQNVHSKRGKFNNKKE